MKEKVKAARKSQPKPSLNIQEAFSIGFIIISCIIVISYAKGCKAWQEKHTKVNSKDFIQKSTQTISKIMK
jgi:hypothetical protein